MDIKRNTTQMAATCEPIPETTENRKPIFRAEPFTSPETVRKTEDGGAINN